MLDPAQKIRASNVVAGRRSYYRDLGPHSQKDLRNSFCCLHPGICRYLVCFRQDDNSGSRAATEQVHHVLVQPRRRMPDIYQVQYKTQWRAFLQIRCDRAHPSLTFNLADPRVAVTRSVHKVTPSINLVEIKRACLAGRAADARQGTALRQHVEQ